MNLYKILKGHEGETFYCLLTGKNFKLHSVTENYIALDDDGFNVSIYGTFFNGGECIIFPSKDQRDWNKWDKENNYKTPKTWSEYLKNEFDEVHEPTLWFDSECNWDKIGNSCSALFKIHQLIEVGYGGNVLCNKKEHWDGDVLGYTISIRPSSKTYLDGYEIIPVERRNNVVSPIMFKTREYAEEFIKYEENRSLLRIFNMVAYSRDIK